MNRYTILIISTIFSMISGLRIVDAQQIGLPANTFTPPPPPSIVVPTPAPFGPASTSAPQPQLAVPPPEAVLKFSGQGPFNSRPFTIADHWEVDWDSPGAMNITLGHLDGKPDEIIGQQAGPSHGSSFQPIGGQYYLKIVGTGNWVVWMVQVGAGMTPASITGTLATAPSLPVAGLPSAQFNGLPSGSTNYSDPSYYQNPIVIVRGDTGVGTGFLIKMGQSTYVVTNQHVISNNPNLILQTIKGQNLVATALQAATDRDLAMFTIKDDGTLPTIPFAPDVAGATHVDDDTIIPGNSQGGGVIVDTPGKVVGVGPQRLEISNPIYPGNSGSPVVDLRLRQAVGVVTEAAMSDTDGFINQNSLANRNSAIQAIRYFSLRFDNVPKWEPINLGAFYRQTHFIEEFHQTSLELISFFKALHAKSQQNDANQRQQQYQQYQYQYQQQQQYPGNPNFNRMPPPQPPQQPQASPDDGVSLTLYRDNPKLSDIMDHLGDSLRESSSDADITANAQTAVMDLNSLAEADTPTMQNLNVFYSFNKTRAQEEMDTRTYIINLCKDINRHLMNSN